MKETDEPYVKYYCAKFDLTIYSDNSIEVEWHKTELDEDDKFEMEQAFERHKFLNPISA